MYKLLYILILFSLFSCKPKEVIKVKYIRDSTDVTELTQKINNLENENLEYKNKLSEQTKINERLQANTNVTVERYDTDKPNTPVKEKVFINRTETSDKESEINKEMISVLTKENERIYNDNLILTKKVDFLEKERNKEPKKKNKWWLFVAGFFTPIILYLLWKSRKLIALG